MHQYWLSPFQHIRRGLSSRHLSKTWTCVGRAQNNGKEYPRIQSFCQWHQVTSVIILKVVVPNWPSNFLYMIKSLLPLSFTKMHVAGTRENHLYQANKARTRLVLQGTYHTSVFQHHWWVMQKHMTAQEVIKRRYNFADHSAPLSLC